MTLSFDTQMHSGWATGLTTDSDDTEFPAIAPTTTEPTTTDAGYFIIDRPGGLYTDIIPYGTDAANEAYAIRIVGWSPVTAKGTVIGDVPSDALWVPFEMGDIAVTLGSRTGVAAAVVLDTHFLADTLVLSVEDSTVLSIFNAVGDGTANTTALLRVKHDGYKKIGVYFDRGTAATCNAMYRHRM